MFRIFFVGKNLLALLLPVTFLLSWAACVSFCAEIAEPHLDNRTAASVNHLDGDDCRSFSSVSENCRLTAAVAVIEARQNTNFSTLSAASAPVLHFRAPLAARETILPDTRQNSPPPLPTKLLFVQLCSFRI